jgi:hypothetical protein
MPNKSNFWLRLRTLLILSFLFFSTSGIAAIGLYSTGVDDEGNLLTAGEIDPHYTLFHAAENTAYDTAYVTTDNPSTWLTAGASYQWINPTGRGNDNLACRYCETPIRPYAFPDYFYSTTFDLTGADLSSVYIEFQVASDNAANISINGKYIGYFSGFTALDTIVLNDPIWFVDGQNTLVFGVANTSDTPNPTGLVVNVLAADIPEPLTLALTGLGLVGIGYKRNKQRKAG